MTLKLFFCYAHEDEALLNKLKAHLRSLQRQGLLDVWHDHEIIPGAEWQGEIDKHLSTADIILLLISPDFMNSDYCYGVELKQALERHKRGEVWVIPVILRPVFWEVETLAELQALPTDAIPVVSSKWHTYDEAFLDIVNGIRRTIENLKLGREATSSFLSQARDNAKKLPDVNTQHETDKVETHVSQQKTKIFGIDLGTTYSCISYIDEAGQAIIVPNSKGDRTTPSVVLFEEKTRVVGKEAKNRAISTPEQVVEMVKRHMGEANWRYEYDGVEYSPEEISSYILRKLVDDAENCLGYPVKDVVISCPAYFGIAEREATFQAGVIAGLNVRAIINEPTAAAIMYGLLNKQQQVALVYDLGGGTFDVTVVAIKGNIITVVATGGDHNLGGRDWDTQLVDYLASQWVIATGSPDDPLNSRETQQELWKQAETIKKALTTSLETNVMLTHAGQSVEVRVTRDKFNELTASLLYRTIDFTETTIESAKARGFKHIDQILLVGGSTMMPQVSEELITQFALPLKMLDPDEAVAKGAAIYGEKLAADELIQIKIAETEAVPYYNVDISKAPEEVVAHAQSETNALMPSTLRRISQLVVTDVASHSFGIVALTTKDAAQGTLVEVISNLVFANNPLPISVSQVFATAEANQEFAELKVMENNYQEKIVEDVSAGEEIGSAVLRLSPHLPQGTSIEVTFELDRQGRLRVVGRETTNNTIVEAVIRTNRGISKNEVRAAKRRLNRLAIY